MKTLLFSAKGRIARAQYWKGVLITLGAGILATVLSMILAGIFGGGSSSASADGGVSISLNGPSAIPVLLFLVFSTWSGICLGIKRSHDRNRSGAFVILSVLPLVNLWYFIEVGFLRGTEGPNQYGPDSLGSAAYVTPLGAY